jgi:predicted amidohydrolase
MQLPKFRAAVVQAAPAYLDCEATVEKGLRLIEEAAAQGARLIVFPETWVPGYPFWYNFESRWNYAPGKRAYARLVKNSVDIPGPTVQILGRAAETANAYVVMGVHERTSSGTLFNSLLFIGSDGSLIGKHRKLVPTYQERMVWAHGDGSTLQVYETGLGRLGGLICWEHWMPLARYALYSQDLQISASVWPTASESFLIAARHMAQEGRCFLLVAATFMTKHHLPEDFELTREMGSAPEVLSRGGSAIIGPDGKFLAGPVYDQETILIADIDLERILEEKQTLDVVGHYARSEVFRLVVNTCPFRSYEAVDDILDQDPMDQDLARLEAMVDEAPREMLRDGLQGLRQRLKRSAKSNT